MKSKQLQPKKPLRRVALKALAASERKVGEMVEFGNAQYFWVERIDEKEGVAHLRRIDELE